MHKVPMFGFLGCAKKFVLTEFIPLGFDMSTAINLFLRRLVGALVIAATSTTTTPPAGTTAPKGQDASLGCPRVVTGGCGLFESCVVVLHLVKS